jgi:hypothetical protein
MSNVEFKSSKPAVHRVEGSDATRKSPRYYTHAVVGDYDRAAQVKSITEWTTYQAKDRWEYEARIANATPGKPEYFRTPGRQANPVALTFDAAKIEKAQEFISNNPQLDAYVLVCVTDNVARFVTGKDGELRVLQWSQSERAAVKASASRSVQRNCLCRNVRVVKVQRG